MSKLPLEELKEKYIPISEFPERYNINVEVVNQLISSHTIRYAEFFTPGSNRRTPHVNPEDVLKALRQEDVV